MGEGGAIGSAPAGASHRRLSQAAALVRCSHPEPVALVTALASLLALAAGRGPGTLWLAGAALTGQLSVGWSNDWLDRRLDRRAQRADKPLAADALPARVVAAAAVAAFVLCLPLSFAYGWLAGIAHLVALGAAYLYNVGLKATAASLLPYATAFGLLPMVVTLGLSPPRWAPIWAIAAGALLGSAAHFTQTLQDIPGDRRLGLRGLPQRAGRSRSALLAILLLLVAEAVVTFGPGRPGPIQLIGLGLTVATASGTAAAAATGRWKLAFRLTMAAAALTVLSFVLSGGRL
jgi:4-hydroxybenzoate polyprenyltransferase